MKILVADRIVATSHDFPTVNCSIDAEDMRYISSLLRNNYSNTILATIRETYANAVDANKENNLSQVPNWYMYASKPFRVEK